MSHYILFFIVDDNRDLHFSPVEKDRHVAVSTVDSTPKQVCTHSVHGLWSNEKIISIVD